MYTYNNLIFENENAKILCSLIHTANPYIVFPIKYITEEWAVSFYNYLDKNYNISSENYVPEKKKVCYVPVYDKLVV